MLGKLSRLPHALREQLNARLDNNEPAKTLLLWLNSLPELQAILQADFHGEPVSEQNLSDYRQRSFRRWQMRQAAFQFAAEAQADHPAPDQPPGESIVDHLVHWISLRFAAAAQNFTSADDPQTELRLLRQFLLDIVSLRRGDLVSRRLQLEQKRLALEESKSQDALEKLFWKWTARPDIQKQLYPHRDPDQIRREVVRMLDRELFGIHRAEDDPIPDPASFI